MANIISRDESDAVLARYYDRLPARKLSLTRSVWDKLVFLLGRSFISLGNRMLSRFDSSTSSLPPSNNPYRDAAIAVRDVKGKVDNGHVLVFDNDKQTNKQTNKQTADLFDNIVEEAFNESKLQRERDLREAKKAIIDKDAFKVALKYIADCMRIGGVDTIGRVLCVPPSIIRLNSLQFSVFCEDFIDVCSSKGIKAELNHGMLEIGHQSLIDYNARRQSETQPFHAIKR